MECVRKREKGLCVSVGHLLRMFPHHGLKQDYNNSIMERPTCRLNFFSLTRLQQCTAVTDIYFIIRKVQPYLLNLRVGKREESTFRNKRSNHSSELVSRRNDTDTTTVPHVGAFLPKEAKESQQCPCVLLLHPAFHLHSWLSDRILGIRNHHYQL